MDALQTGMNAMDAGMDAEAQQFRKGAEGLKPVCRDAGGA